MVGETRKLLCFTAGNMPLFGFLYYPYPNTLVSRDSVVGIATAYGLNDGRVGVRVPVGSRIFAYPIVQTGSVVHPITYTMGAGGSSTEVKRLGREVDHPPPTSAEVKKIWIYTFTPPCIFMA
jgi:hypothetical protein